MRRDIYITKRLFAAVPARDVVEGDLYANGATVTYSGPSKPGSWSASSSPEWTIECGENFAQGSDSDHLIVVGRLSPFPPSTDEETETS